MHKHLFYLYILVNGEKENKTDETCNLLVLSLSILIIQNIEYIYIQIIFTFPCSKHSKRSYEDTLSGTSILNSTKEDTVNEIIPLLSNNIYFLL